MPKALPQIRHPDKSYHGASSLAQPGQVGSGQQPRWASGRPGQLGGREAGLEVGGRQGSSGDTCSHSHPHLSPAPPPATPGPRCTAGPELLFAPHQAQVPGGMCEVSGPTRAVPGPGQSCLEALAWEEDTALCHPVAWRAVDTTNTAQAGRAWWGERARGSSRAGLPREGGGRGMGNGLEAPQGTEAGTSVLGFLAGRGLGTGFPWASG